MMSDKELGENHGGVTAVSGGQGSAAQGGDGAPAAGEKDGGERKTGISERQLVANQQNAQQSTGPKTEVGKAIVARNATRHGVFARIADGGEERGAYEEMLAGLRESLRPVGQMECLLVEKIAVDELRLGRLIAFETASVRADMQNLKRDMEAQHGRKESKYSERPGEAIPLEFVRYTDDISTADIEAQRALVARLCDRKLTLEEDDRVLEFVYREKVKPCEWDEPLPLDWREQAKARLGGMNKSHRGRILSEVIEREDQILVEMKAVVEVRSKVAEDMPLHTVPPDGHMEKILKYETALQRSIARNMDLLRKLQEGRAKGGG